MPNPWNRDGNAIASADFLGTTNNLPLKIRTNDVEHMRVGVTGNVGIGTSSPATALHVVGDRVRLESGGRRLLLRSDGADVDVQSDTNNLFIHSSGPAGKNNVIMNPFGGEGNVGVGTTLPATKLHVVGDRVTLESGGRRLLLRSDGADVDVQSDTNNLFIHSSGPAGKNNVIMNPFGGEGNVGIGTTLPTAKLEVAGDIRANDVFLTSDARLKTSVKPISGALAKLEHVRGVSFARQPMDPSDVPPPRRVGVIAQDVAPVLPELIDASSEGGYLAVDYSGLTAVLLEALKELSDENDRMKRRIDSLESRVADRGSGIVGL